MAGRLTSLESELYKTLKGARDQTLSANELKSGQSGQDPSQVLAALSGLMAKSLIQAKTNEKKETFFTAIDKQEAKKTGALDQNEQIAYNCIRGAGNMGIWIRNIKTETNLPQAVLNKVMRSLEKRDMIKTVKSVKAPTKKLYMLSSFTPSADLTGGPFYDGHNIDVGLIGDLSNAAFRFVQDRSFPRKIPKRSTISEEIYVPNPIYAPSHTSKLPSPDTILEWFVKNDVVKVKIGVEHVIQIMSMLVYEGKVEIIKPIRKQHEEGWNSDLEHDGGAADADEAEQIHRERAKGSRKRSREDASGSDDSSDSDDGRAKKRRKKEKEKEKEKKRRAEEKKEEKKEKKRKEKEKERKKKKAEKKKKEKEKKRKAKEKEKAKKEKIKAKYEADSDSGDSDRLISVGDTDKSKKKTKKKSALSSSDSSSSSSSSSSSDSDSDSSDSDSDSDSDNSGSDSRSDNDKKKRKTKDEILPGTYQEADDHLETMLDGMGGRFNFHDNYDPFTDRDVVYRAVRPSNFNWPVNEAPCGLCPIQKFCAEEGPVNPIGCNYFAEWDSQENFKLKLDFQGLIGPNGDIEI